MAQALLPEGLWSLIAAHLPARHPSPKGGRPRINDRATLTDILFVPKTGIPWEYLPREFGCGSGRTCWRRLHEWMQAGVWQRVHEAVLQRLREDDQIMWFRASVDAASVPAPAGGEHTGRNPTDRGKLGCKHHLLVNQRGLPLVAQLSGAQVHDSRLLIPLVESIPAVKGYPDVRANAQVSCTLIGHMPHGHIGLGCAGGASRHELHATAWSHAKGSADGVGSLSGLWDGFIASEDCASDMSDAQTSIRHSFRLPARSSVGGTSKGFVRRSKWPYLGKWFCHIRRARMFR